MLNIIGIGLRGYSSLTIQERDVILNSDMIFLDSYTSVISSAVISEIEKRIGKKVESISREFIEGNNALYELAMKKDISVLVSGDGLLATTHNEIRYECLKKGIRVEVYENASILNVVTGLSGVSPYKVGAPVSIPRVSEKFFPLSVYKKIQKNLENKRHTTLLLDTADDTPMTVVEALDILESMENRMKSGIINDELKLIVAHSVGSNSESFVFGSLSSIRDRDIKEVPATIIILSDLDENETLYVNAFCQAI